jgi:hypothetical protein
MLALGARDLQEAALPDAGGIGNDGEVAAAPRTQEKDDGMSVVARALSELNHALAADPDNHNLSRLVLMVHRTRGELLRRTPTRGLRAG